MGSRQVALGVEGAELVGVPGASSCLGPRKAPALGLYPTVGRGL